MTTSREQIQALVGFIQQAAFDALAEYEKAGTPVPSLDSVDPHPLDDAQNNIALKRIVKKLEGACDQLCTALAQPAHTIVNRSQDFYWACLRVAVENNVADALVGHPNGLHISKLSTAVHIEPGKLTSVLRFLGARHCFREVEENVWANNRLSVKLRSSDPVGSYSGLLTRECQLAAWYMHESLVHPVDGPSKDPRQSPFVRAIKTQIPDFKGTFYDYLSTYEDRRVVMGRGMIAMNTAIGTLSVLDAFPWGNFSTICDVGSGIGAFSTSLLERHPKLQVTLHDRPETVALAQQTWKRDHAKIAGQVSFAPGNFFEDIPAKNLDLYYLRNILHNWPDAETILILKSVRRAISPKSRVLIRKYLILSLATILPLIIVDDYVMQPLNRTHDSQAKNTGLEIAPAPLLPTFGSGLIRLHSQDVLMLNIYNAKERTISEVTDLAREADLTLEKIWDLGETSVLEFVAN
jgi:2-polyprenyl-3-methyl-5-hydroxy-6-metoxy-1,4-benzoquinol methylase